MSNDIFVKQMKHFRFRYLVNLKRVWASFGSANGWTTFRHLGLSLLGHWETLRWPVVRNGRHFWLWATTGQHYEINKHIVGSDIFW